MQTPEGAQKARNTMYQRYGRNYFSLIGRRGGSVTKSPRECPRCGKDKYTSFGICDDCDKKESYD